MNTSFCNTALKTLGTALSPTQFATLIEELLPEQQQTTKRARPSPIPLLVLPKEYILEPSICIDDRVRVERECKTPRQLAHYLPNTMKIHYPLLRSVTRVVGQYFERFDEQRIVARIMNGRRYATDPTYAYYQCSEQAIRNGFLGARLLGERLHAFIEASLRRCCFVPRPLQDRAYRQFASFHRNCIVANGLVPCAIEQTFASDADRLVGRVDAVFSRRNDSKQVLLFDWKRSNSPLLSAADAVADDRAMSPLDCYADCALSRHALQLNLLRRTMPKDKKVVGMFVCRFHGNADDDDDNDDAYELVHINFIDESVLTRVLHVK